MDEVAPDTHIGEGRGGGGHGMSMDVSSTNINELEIQGIQRRWGESLNHATLINSYDGD